MLASAYEDAKPSRETFRGRAGPHGTTEEDSGVEVSESAQFDRISVF